MDEAQSPTLMIQDVFGEVTPKEEAIEAQWGAEEEEGSSCTPGQEDTENEKTIPKNKLLKSYLSRLRLFHLTHSSRRFRGRDCNWSWRWSANRSSSGADASGSNIYYTLHDSSPHYDRLRKKKPAFPVTAFLRCKDHPFFEGLPNIFEDINLFEMIFSLLKEISYVNVLWIGLKFEQSLSIGSSNQSRNWRNTWSLICLLRFLRKYQMSRPQLQRWVWESTGYMRFWAKFHIKRSIWTSWEDRRNWQRSLSN